MLCTAVGSTSVFKSLAFFFNRTQTNVYRSAQERKIKYFEGFVAKAEVVVPPHHELRRRTAIRNDEMGGPLPEDVINAMKGELPCMDVAMQCSL